jgi:predicted ATPase
MIKNIRIENFKCFKNEIAFGLSRVNLFAGYNGRGKSTVLQVLLLVAQSFYKNNELRYLETKGILCNQGRFSDLLTIGSNSKQLSFSFEGDSDDEKSLKLVYKEYKDRSGQLSEIWVNGKNYVEGRTQIGNSDKKPSEAVYWNYPHEVDSYFQKVWFIGANRQGPKMFEEKDDINQNNPIGCNGDHSLNIIAENKDLRERVSEIVSRVMDGGEIDLSGNDEHGNKYDILNLNFKGVGSSESVRSINFGFGYSYVLPIIIAALKMKDGILLIENPEAHLHPQAQSRLMKELARLAVENNIQLFVETHSEHIVNAIRLCIVQKEYPISNKDVSIHFFDKNMDVKHLDIDEDAQIPDWPLGFFDQNENDAALILKLGILR